MHGGDNPGSVSSNSVCHQTENTWAESTEPCAKLIWYQPCGCGSLVQVFLCLSFYRKDWNLPSESSSVLMGLFMNCTVPLCSLYLPAKLLPLVSLQQQQVCSLFPSTSITSSADQEHLFLLSLSVAYWISWILQVVLPVWSRPSQPLPSPSRRKHVFLFFGHPKRASKVFSTVSI